MKDIGKCFFFFLLLTTVRVNMLYSQAQSKEFKCNIKFRYSSFEHPMASNMQPLEKFFKLGNYQIEFTYKLFYFFDAGAYTGFSRYEIFQRPPSGRSDTVFTLIGEVKRKTSPFFGINANVHILPIIFKKDSRFDIYINTRIGGFVVPSPDNYLPHGFHSDYSIFGGLMLNLTKRTGIFAEYGIRKKIIYNASRFQFGLNYRF